MMQESNNDFFSIDAILLFDCCPIDVRYNIEEQTGLKRVWNVLRTDKNRRYIEATTSQKRRKDETISNV